MTLHAPPSLEPSVIERSWKDSNGELGLLPQDVGTFLDACERDQIRVFGWEMWLVDHQWDGGEGAEPAPGGWTGLIPNLRGGTCTWTGEGDASITRDEIAELDWRPETAEALHPHIRFNVTLDM